MLDPAVAVTDVGSVLLIGAASAPGPRRVREYVAVGGLLLALGALFAGLSIAATCAAIAVIIAAAKLIALGRLMSVVGSDVTDENLLAALRPFMAPRKFSAGETIFTRGDKATSLFYLIEGSINLPEINEHVAKGTLFGEIALFTRERRRTLGAKAETDISALEMQAEDLITVVKRNPRIGFYLIGLITQRLTHDFSYLSELFYSAEAERRQLFELATRDGLTGVANRRSFDERLNVEWAHAMRSKRPISLIILDIDHFKQYNDTFGHGAGDTALKSVARAMSKCVQRRSDLFARYGGEEFSAILPGTNSEAANRIAETMRAAVAALAIPHPANEGGIVTVSAGIATQHADRDATMAGFMQASDDYLYRAKAAGRNCIESTVLGDVGEGDDQRVIA
ncbi:MAG TPA: diguanylate cyclase [Candidatus Binatia bacterium]|nr:diguanylate cyclase [Candidatus Binatia bacterium]